MGMKVLVVDDQAANRIILRHLLLAEGHECIEAENGEEAVRFFERHQPEFVLMDIMMPVMDGYEAAEAIKGMSLGRYVPIIFLTAKTEQDSLIQCLEFGDDYLVKPISEILLKAKINAHVRTQDLTQQINAKNEELTALHDTLQQEHQMGEHVLSHAMQRSWKGCQNVRSFMSPLSTFNGDLLLLAPDPNGGVYVFLGDMTGHGLSASIGAVPVSQVFFTMCGKGRPVPEIAYELNVTLKAFLPEYMFCAATLLHLNADGATMRLWGGGLPPAYVVREGEGVVDVLQSNNLALGILSSDEFDGSAATYHFEDGDRLLLLTDGVHDVQNAQGELYGEVGVLKAIDQQSGNGFDAVLVDIERYSGSGAQKDDISLVELLARPVEQDLAELKTYESFAWTQSFRLDAACLKAPDALQAVMATLPSQIEFELARHRLQIVLTELFSNALEHGLLALDSSIKNDVNGFAEYYFIRASRLQALEEGEVSIVIAYRPECKGQELLVEVSDSGKGFDYKRVGGSQVSEQQTLAWGRGLKMVQGFGCALEFFDSGSRVQVKLPLLDSEAP